VKTRLCGVLTVILLTSGCVHTVHLYPVQGPLSRQAPPPVLIAKVTGALTPGSVSVALPEKEVCKGQWANVRQTGGAAAAGARTGTDLASAWDVVYGPGFYVSHVLGERYYVRAVASCSHGNTLSLEMYTPVGGGAGIKGVAKDDAGNIFKLAFP